MVAGQISSALKLDLALGLPRRTTLAEIVAAGGSGLADAGLFRSEGKLDLWLWVFETHGTANATPRAPSLVRSLLNRVRRNQ